MACYTVQTIVLPLSSYKEASATERHRIKTTSEDFLFVMCCLV